IVSSLGRQIVSMAPSYVRLASDDATAGARDALRLQLLGAAPDPRDCRSPYGWAVHVALGDRWTRSSRDARAHARCRVQLAATPATSPRGRVAEDARDDRLPECGSTHRSLDTRRGRDACLDRDPGRQGARSRRRSRPEGAVPALVLSAAHGHAQPAAPRRVSAAAHAARALSRRYRLPRLCGLGARLWLRP